jgi:hypothetical protein
MKNGIVLAFLLFFGFSVLVPAQTTCASYTFSQTPKYDDVSDLSGHNSGDHLFAGTATGTCTYSSTGNQYCQVVNAAIGTVEPTDSGELATWPVGYHVSQPSTTNGSQTTPDASGGNTANSVAVVAWEYCLTKGCYFTVTSNPVSVPASAVWSHTQNAGFTCPAKLDPTYGSGGGGGGGQDTCPGCSCDTVQGPIPVGVRCLLREHFANYR